MQSVAAILDRHEQVFRPEGEVVECRVMDVAQVEERERARLSRRPLLCHLEQPAEASGGLTVHVRVARLREIEFAEGCPGTEYAVLGTLEWRAPHLLGQCIGIRGCRWTHLG